MALLHPRLDPPAPPVKRIGVGRSKSGARRRRAGSASLRAVSRMTTPRPAPSAAQVGPTRDQSRPTTGGQLPSDDDAASDISAPCRRQDGTPAAHPIDDRTGHPQRTLQRRGQLTPAAHPIDDRTGHPQRTLQRRGQ